MWDKKSIWTWTIGSYLYPITTTRKEREAALLPACLPDDCQLDTTDDQADRIHEDVEAAC